MITWELSKIDLEYALRLVCNVPAKSGVVCSEYIRFSKHNSGTLLTLAADLAAQAFLSESFPFKKSLYIDRRLFEPFVSAGKELKGNTYTLAMKKDGVLTIKHGSRVAVFAVHKKVSGYSDAPVYDKPQNTRIYESWTKIMQCAVACATDDPVTPTLNCVYVVPKEQHLILYSSNTKVVFVGKGRTKKLPKSAIAFPLILASRLEGNDMETVTWDNKSACLSSERGTIWQPVKSAARKHFPYKDMDTLVDTFKTTKPVLSIAAEDMGIQAERIADYLAAVSREDLVLRIKASKDDKRAKLVSGTGETLFTEHLTLLKPARADVELHWPLDEVLPALEFSKNQGTAAIYIADTGRSMYATEDISLVVAKRSK
jgi:hypothetical protein